MILLSVASSLMLSSWYSLLYLFSHHSYFFRNVYKCLLVQCHPSLIQPSILPLYLMYNLLFLLQLLSANLPYRVFWLQHICVFCMIMIVNSVCFPKNISSFVFVMEPWCSPLCNVLLNIFPQQWIHTRCWRSCWRQCFQIHHPQSYIKRTNRPRIAYGFQNSLCVWL